MNKSELVDAVASAAGLEKRQAEAAVGAMVAEIMAQAKAGQPVSIFGFGTFKPTARAARVGRNPRTSEPVKIAASKGVKFQPSTAFKSALNAKKGTAKKAAAKKAVPAKKAPASKAPARKTTAAAKTTATKATATTKAPAKTAASKASAKKTPARSTAAKKR